MRPEVSLLTERTPRVVAFRKLLRRKYRDERREFLAEGPQAVREALALPSGAPGSPSRIIVTPAALAREPSFVDRAQARGVEVDQATDAALASLSETTSPQGIVAVCSYLDTPLDAVLAAAPRLVAVLVEIRDPGNAGTVLRAADAAGADAVIFTDDSVDPYNGKAVRASAGSLFHPAVVRGGDPHQVLAQLRLTGLRTLATSGGGESDLFTLADSGALIAPSAWLFGNEAQGLPDDLLSAVDAQVRIPLYGRAESLNLAVAAGICLYTSARAQSSS